MTEQELKNYVGNDLQITKIYGEIVKGFASTFTRSVDNEPAEASIFLDFEGGKHAEEIYLSEVKSIEVIND